LPELDFTGHDEPLAAVHDQMFRSAVLRHRKQAGSDQHEAAAFGLLRDLIVREAQLSPARPQLMRGRPDHLGAQPGALRPRRRLD
jgi:hypothetical protein